MVVERMDWRVKERKDLRVNRGVEYLFLEGMTLWPVRWK